jgi:glycine cleavage system H lipoate-binding protein/ABC-type phosphate transport system substrate-binding protein
MNSNIKAMKKFILVLIGTALLLQCQAVNFRNAVEDLPKASAQKGSLIISATPDLFDLTTRWASEYSGINPLVKINVENVQNADALNGTNTGNSLSFISYDYQNSDNEGSQWKMIIGRDAIVPVINSNNPFLSEIMRQGVSAEEFAQIFKNSENHNWSNLLENSKGAPINFYLIDNTSITKAIAGFMNINAESINGNKVAGGKEMIAAIQNDPYAIGFCKLTDITGQSGLSLASGISMLPIDKNGNGKMDYIEKIYDNVTNLSRGIWIGKFPTALCRNLYVTAAAKPTGDNEIAFLKYVLTNGQQQLDFTGFNSLTNTERLSKIDRLPVIFLKAQTSNSANLLQLMITIIAGIICIIAIVAMVLRYKKQNNPISAKTGLEFTNSITEKSLTMLNGLYFDKSHTWAFMETDGSVKVGIDDFLQHVTGKITSIKMKRPGDKVKKGDSILTLIQKGKRLNISAPVSGIIKAENAILFTDPSLLNSAPYAQGWIYLIEPTNWLRETQFLLMAEKYGEWLKNEFSRLRDFLAHAMMKTEPAYAYVVLQDGGEVADNVLENLGPEVWEDFQTEFIDKTAETKNI